MARSSKVNEMNVQSTKAPRHESTQEKPHPRPSCLRASVPPCLSRTAFSFAEVMFAVVILGIGFIMIAAIFPVAMQQSQATNDESIAAAISRESANTVAA